MAAALAVVTSARRVGAQDWSALPTVAEASVAMAYDSDPGEIVLQLQSGATQVWDGSAWTERAAASSSAPNAGAMAYDPVRDRTVFFGTSAIGGQGTWEWDGSTWTMIAPATTSPPPRTLFSMAYAGNGKVMLFGGLGAGADTWEWDGADWIDRTPLTTSPSARRDHTCVYEAHTGRVLLYGEYLVGGDLWAWDSTVGTWTELSPLSPTPAADSTVSLAYDSLRSRTILFGGTNGPLLDETWSFDGTSWTQLTPATSPSARLRGAMAYDAANDRVVLHGGDFGGGPPPTDAWAFVGPPVDSATYAVGAGPRDVAVGNLDGVAGFDLVTADHDDDTISVLRNDGAGGFAAAVAVALSGSDVGPTATTVCDLDDDGDADDVAVACDDSSTIALVTDAGGTPSVNSYASTGLRCVHIASGDLDADPRDDVVVARQGELLSGGGGVDVVMNGAAPASLPASAATRVIRVGACDLDADGDQDVVAVAHGAVQDELVLYENAGDGTFTIAGTLLLGSTGLANGLCCGDLDGDGDDDLAITVTTLFPTPSQELRVYLYTGGGALGADDYTAVGGVAVAGSLGVDLACGDFENDGLQDVTVVSAGSGEVATLYGFDGSAFASTDAGASGTNPIAAVMADLNGDGTDDLVVANLGSDDVTVTLVTPPSLTPTYGTGCAGSNGIPAIAAQNSPTLGATDFAVLLSNGRVSAPAVLLFGLAPTAVPLSGGCTLLVESIATVLHFTSATGTAAQPVRIPPEPAALGFNAYFQWGVFDTGGAFLATLALSDALRIQIGE